MHTKRLKPQLLLLLLSLPISVLLSGCDDVTVQDGSTCAAAGRVSQGMLCSHLRAATTSVLSEAEGLDFLDAQPKPRTCVPVPGLSVCADNQASGAPVMLPARGAAICMPSADWNTLATELEAACRDMGNSCNYAAVSAVIAKLRAR